MLFSFTRIILETPAGLPFNNAKIVFLYYIILYRHHLPTYPYNNKVYYIRCTYVLCLTLFPRGKNVNFYHMYLYYNIIIYPSMILHKCALLSKLPQYTTHKVYIISSFLFI